MEHIEIEGVDRDGVVAEIVDNPTRTVIRFVVW